LYKIPAKTLFLGKNLIFMPECHSTNDAMLLLCQKDSPPEGTVIVTNQQTAGRGQRGNKWEAEPGKNLTFTILVKPSFLPVQKQFFLNIYVSLGIRDYLTDLRNLKVQIKWPNDILVDEKKICGILIENQLSGVVITNSAAGIGFNVNQQLFSIMSATSLASLTGNEFDLSDELTALLVHLEKRYLQLRALNFDALLKDYMKNLFMLNELYTFTDREGTFEGIIKGIDPSSGKLMVDKHGLVMAYDLKEIQFAGKAK
jgi:BirA family transcriptional regulator, biotin operon repressor / biotin---[acetyl-CoA-carboxylase] ligase